MYRKQNRIVILIVLTISLITACSQPTLSDINCQPDDVDSNPPFLHLSEDAIMPGNTPFPDQLTDYSRVALSENQLTVTDVLCTIRVYESVDLAASALTLLCQQSTGQQVDAQIGDNACRFENGSVIDLHFQQGDAVVTIREDAGGAHILQWAEAVNGRLDN